MLSWATALTAAWPQAWGSRCKHLFAESSPALLPLLRWGEEGKEEHQSCLKAWLAVERAGKLGLSLQPHLIFSFFIPLRKDHRRVFWFDSLKHSGVVGLWLKQGSAVCVWGGGPRAQIKGEPSARGVVQTAWRSLSKRRSQALAPPTGGCLSCTRLGSWRLDLGRQNGWAWAGQVEVCVSLRGPCI